MIDFGVYYTKPLAEIAMKAHLEFPKKRKFLLKAKEDGITRAQNLFNRYLKEQPMFFSWDQVHNALPAIVEDFKKNFATKPCYVNSPDKDAIVQVFEQSLNTEYSNIIESYDVLPIIQPVDWFAIRVLVGNATIKLFYTMLEPISSSFVCKSRDPDAMPKPPASMFKDFLDTHTMDDLKRLSVEEFDKSLLRFQFSPAVIEAAFYELNRLWDKIPTPLDALKVFHIIDS